MDKITQSIKLACEVHDGQTDKGGQPYIFHCLHVMREVERQTRNYSKLNRELAICAAVLHDILEDCKDNEYLFVEEKIGSIGGVILVGIIRNLSRKNSNSYEHYIEKLVRYEIESLIKISDLKHNMQLKRLKKYITQKDLENFNKYRKALLTLENYNR